MITILASLVLGLMPQVGVPNCNPPSSFPFPPQPECETVFDPNCVKVCKEVYTRLMQNSYITYCQQSHAAWAAYDNAAALCEQGYSACIAGGGSATVCNAQLVACNNEALEDLSDALTAAGNKKAQRDAQVADIWTNCMRGCCYP